MSARIETHNSGGSTFTAPFRPWDLVVEIRFPTEASAVEFERYLKTGSGRAFMERHLLSRPKATHS